MISITDSQLALLHHALGLRPDRREPYRNHFLAGTGHHDMANLEVLELHGLMKRRKAPTFCEESDVVFYCTDEGRDYAIDNLPPEPKRTKYEEYLHADCDDSFSLFLGIRKPKIETSSRYTASGSFEMQYRMYREQWDNWDRCHYRDVQGEWATTKKAAKECYKAALKAYQLRHKVAA